uniref:Uncharacterized protein LOC111120359 n=1 Tax=Crassostrea virginica TaxID=6565 RepID=A0A8B8CLS6_CRAVI|nr:uncharacterized protein LOC111120359 [Crassostrea virginica]
MKSMISLGTFLFICLDIGPIWIMELDKANERNSATNPTQPLTNTTTSSQNTRNLNFIQLDDDVFIYAIEQSFLLFMIIGRWTLPKGQMSRDKLSNLLLVLIGKACDMTDFFTLFSHRNVAKDRSFTIVVLLVWSLSVFQFPISFTESRDDDVAINIHRNRQYMQVAVRTLNVCLKTEIWSILASIFMQEFPFLVCRSYAVGALGIVDDTIIFFLFKNCLIIAMYMYRLVSLCLETDPYRDLATAVVEAEIEDRNNSIIRHEGDRKEETVTLDLTLNGKLVSAIENTMEHKEKCLYRRKYSDGQNIVSLQREPLNQWLDYLDIYLIYFVLIMDAEGTHARRLTLAKAIGVRLLYLVHCLLAISRVMVILNEPRLWIYALGVLLLALEGIHAVCRRDGLEHKWVSLGTLIFICLDIGPIWIIELDKVDYRLSWISNGGRTNVTSITGSNQSTHQIETRDILLELSELNIKYSSEFIQLDDDVFIYAIEQSFLLFMIIGRWTLPKGQMSRDKLSNLLLVLIGKACDMTDFFTLFSHRNVAKDRSFTIVVLLAWSLSVFQFPISFTESRDDNVVISIHRNRQYMQVAVRTLNVCLKTEIWSILASIFMQEFPFLVCRSYAVGALGIVDDTIIFFLFKNCLIIAMYLYRLVSLCLETDPYRDRGTVVVEAENVTTLSFNDVDCVPTEVCVTESTEEDVETSVATLEQGKIDKSGNTQGRHFLGKSGSYDVTDTPP